MGLIDIAKEFLQMVSGELDQYTTENGFVEANGNKVTLFTPSHIQFARYGRGPGKKPPLDPILDFVKDRGIIFEDTTQRGTAFAIMNSISKKGTKNWVPDAPNALEEAIDKNLKEYSETIAKVFRISVDKEVQEIYKENIPSKVNFKI